MPAPSCGVSVVPLRAAGEGAPRQPDRGRKILKTVRPRISVLVPARDEEERLPACLDSIRAASPPVAGGVEVVVAVNRSTDRTEEIARAAGAVVVHDEGRSMAAVRNAAARASFGEILVTIDADSRMSAGMLAEIDRLLRGGKYVGGGVAVLPERWSAGIAVTGLLIVVLVLWRRAAGGMFWCRREDFEAIGGFDERLLSVEDLDFARRLRVLGRSRGQRLKRFTRSWIVTSCRKFDRFGDWHLLRHPVKTWRLIHGRARTEADEYYYDFPR